ncbi:sigma-70 family RNA polymerase sigma factor [Solirubrobacter phytolaccae]|uniref:Sigma-70 family RNA polymerase sigma factor n=1 Tax=Solirubrobacter phytolaccae TaxID=1404360 RepID=A0A9X3N729_9ACTN|nr:sigma-70 family RNA polymerase sigma factor [Solirubrobacter phytolaccae]MDA0179514.1 sigma-70 family RNA polymerase sigma factor [Solirubrobacter phytolaccae]
MLHTHHQNREYVAALDAERQRRSTADGRALERMIAAAARGDQSAWSALVSRFSGRIARVARGYGLNPYQADDVAQETWLRLYRGLERVRDPQALGAWVDTTARRESLRALKRRGREDLTGEDLFVDVVAYDDPDEALLAERRVALAAALARLPERQQRLMESLLADTEPSYADVSAELGLPVGSIGPTRGRCVERLRRILAPELADQPR